MTITIGECDDRQRAEQKSVDLMNLFLSFCDDSEVEKYIDVENERRSESGEYLLAAIKKWLKDNLSLIHI